MRLLALLLFFAPFYASATNNYSTRVYLKMDTEKEVLKFLNEPTPATIHVGRGGGHEVELLDSECIKKQVVNVRANGGTVVNVDGFTLGKNLGDRRYDMEKVNIQVIYKTGTLWDRVTRDIKRQFTHASNTETISFQCDLQKRYEFRMPTILCN